MYYNCIIIARPLDPTMTSSLLPFSEDDPTTATVCGTSGILFDTSYPTGGYLIDDATAAPVARPAPTLRGGALA